MNLFEVPNLTSYQLQSKVFKTFLFEVLLQLTQNSFFTLQGQTGPHTKPQAYLPLASSNT